MRISDWSSDVCSSDLIRIAFGAGARRNDFFAGSPTGDVDRRRDNLFAYGELLIPITEPAQDIVALHRLSLTGALRFADYSDARGQIGSASCRARGCQYV